VGRNESLTKSPSKPLKGGNDRKKVHISPLETENGDCGPCLQATLRREERPATSSRTTPALDLAWGVVKEMLWMRQLA